MTTKGALIWDFNQPWSIDERHRRSPSGLGRGSIGDGRVVPLRPPPADRGHPRAGFPGLGGHEGAGIAQVNLGHMWHMCRTVIVTLSRAKGKDAEPWLGLTAKGGTCAVIVMGSFGDNEANGNVATPTSLQKRLQGSLFGGGNPHYDIPELLAMHKLGDLNLDADR